MVLGLVLGACDSHFSALPRRPLQAHSPRCPRSSVTAPAGKQTRWARPGPVEHGPACHSSAGAFPPQGPRARAGTFPLRSGDLSKLTTGQAPVMPGLWSSPSALGQRFRGLNPESAEAPPCQRSRQPWPRRNALQGPHGAQPTHEELSAAHPAEEWAFLKAAPSSRHSHSPSGEGRRQEADSDQAQ